MISPFMRIGGLRIYPLPLLSIVQTDGSYSRRKGGAVAYILKDHQSKEICGAMHKMPSITSSTEAEWASVAIGIEKSLEKNIECLGVENDCLGVINALIHRQNNLKQAYARHYRQKIYDCVDQVLWVGIRWIPRKLNRADDLFREYSNSTKLY